MEYNNILKQAFELTNGTDNVEYVRGICELIAELYPKDNVDAAERALEIAHDINIHPNVIACLY